MKINPNASELLRSEQTRAARQAESATPRPEQAPARSSTPRSDSVQISDAGRALASRTDGAEGAELSAERVAELRRRVLEGAYNSVQLAGEVAQRMLQRGDV
jgi:anti-sigma28 factor (negative regulator of flagellin synthesis)